MQPKDWRNQIFGPSSIFAELTSKSINFRFQWEDLNSVCVCIDEIPKHGLKHRPSGRRSPSLCTQHLKHLFQHSWYHFWPSLGRQSAVARNRLFLFFKMVSNRYILACQDEYRQQDKLQEIAKMVEAGIDSFYGRDLELSAKHWWWSLADEGSSQGKEVLFFHHFNVCCSSRTRSFEFSWSLNNEALVNNLR